MDGQRKGETHPSSMPSCRCPPNFVSPYIFSDQRTFGYVRVIGDLNRFNGFNFLKVYNIQPIHDAHEIYYHILQTMVDTLSTERGPPVSYTSFSFHPSILFIRL